MVLSKSSKERNKTLMVLKFASGMKAASKTTKTPVDSSKTNKSVRDSGGIKTDKSACTGNRASLKNHESGQEGRISQPSNRTRLSITHATSGLDSVEDERKSHDFLCYRTGHPKRSSISNNAVRRVSLAGAKGCVDLNDALHDDINGGHMELKVASRGKTNKGHVELNVASHDEKNNSITRLSVTSCDDTNKETNIDLNENSMNLVSNKDGDNGSIVDIIKEIEAIPLVSLEEDDTLATGDDARNGKSTRRLSKSTTYASSSTESQDTGISSLTTSPSSSRLQTASRTSNETAVSSLSNNSKSSRKSLAERIMERNEEHRASISPSSSVLDSFSAEMPTVRSSSICEDSHFSSTPTKLFSESSSVGSNSMCKTKHSPDLVAVSGENAQPIMRRCRRARKILTAE